MSDSSRRGPQDPDIPGDNLVGRLRASVPTAGLSVDFADVQAEVERRRRVRRSWTSVSASVATIAAVSIGLSVTSRPTTSATATGRSMESVASAPAMDQGAAVAAPESTDGAAAALPPASALCPPGLDVPLPASTEQGFDPSSALVPATVPDSVVVCRYSGATGLRVAAVQLAGGFDGFTSDLRAVRSGTPIANPCPQTPQVPDRVRAMVHSARGVVWVEASGDGCWRTATNGSFTTDASVAEALRRAADQGQWPGLRFQLGFPGDPCTDVTTGQLGTDRELVPSDATSVTVCRTLLDGTPKQGRTIGSAIDAGRIIAAINALKPQPLVGCTWRVPAGPIYWVSIGSSHGPDQLIAINPRCQPQLTTDRLQADDPGSTVLAAIKAATGW